MPPQQRSPRAGAFACLFFSGFSALVYQVVWTRLAFSAFGIVTPVLSVVVSVFMLGLGLGAWGSVRALAAWERRGRSPLALYALLELLVGALATGVPALFELGRRLLLGAGEMDSTRYLVSSAAVIAAALLPACACMGATIPTMMAWLEREGEGASSFSWLYLANAAGAAAGTAATAAVLIETLGFRRSGLAAAAINAGLCLYALSLSSRGGGGPRASAPRAARARGGARSGALAALFATGFCSMGAEVIWVRAFAVALGTTIYAFAGVLATYLTAMGLGTFFYRRRAPAARARFEPGVWLAAAGAACALPMATGDPRLRLGAAGVLAGLAPFCALLGWLTPALVEDVSGGDPGRAGAAYAVNIAGCVLGPLAASYLLLPNFGARAALAWLAVPLAAAGVGVGAAASARRRAFAAAAGALAAGLTLFVSRGNEDFAGLYGRSALLRRDYAATVIATGAGPTRHLFVNGVSITVLGPVTKMMAHLPVRAHAGRPRTALVICFGMGTTYRSLLSWGLRTTAVELVPSVVAVFPYFYADAEAALRDPNGRIVIDDGRRFLSRTSERYDIVTIDPPPPPRAAGSGLLYSEEFYAQLKEHLNPGGIVQQWQVGGDARLFAAVARSLTRQFPYVRAFAGLAGGCHFLASESPIVLQSSKEFAARMPEAAARDLEEWAPGVPLSTWLEATTAREIPLAEALAADGASITDDRPYNEYDLLRRWGAR
jgi:predicted membrane-bound spermidine synthase